MVVGADVVAEADGDADGTAAEVDVVELEPLLEEVLSDLGGGAAELLVELVEVGELVEEAALALFPPPSPPAIDPPATRFGCRLSGSHRSQWWCPLDPRQKSSSIVMQKG